MNISQSRTSASIPAQSVHAANGPASAKAMQSKSAPAMQAPKMPPRPPAPETGGKLTDRTSGLARLDGVADAIMDRVRNAALEGADGEAGSFREAAQYIEHGLERLRNGYADGTLSPKDIDRGFGNLFQGATDMMNAGRQGGGMDSGMEGGMDSAVQASSMPIAAAAAAPMAMPTEPTRPGPVESEAPEGDSAMAASIRERLSGFVDHVTERALGAGYPDGERQAVAEAATEIFNQAASRLENAVFSPGQGDSIDRDGLASLFQSTFTALQGQIQAMLGDQPTAPAAMYGPGAGPEAINSPIGRVDFSG